MLGPLRTSNGASQSTTRESLPTHVNSGRGVCERRSLLTQLTSQNPLSDISSPARVEHSWSAILGNRQPFSSAIQMAGSTSAVSPWNRSSPAAPAPALRTEPSSTFATCSVRAISGMPISLPLRGRWRNPSCPHSVHTWPTHRDSRVSRGNPLAKDQVLKSTRQIIGLALWESAGTLWLPRSQGAEFFRNRYRTQEVVSSILISSTNYRRVR